MPQAIGTFFAKVAGAIITGLEVIGFSTATAVAIVDVGFKLAALAALNSLYNKFFVPDLGTSAQSFTINVRGTIEHDRIIYGETLAGGLIWYMNSAGPQNQDLYHGIAIAGHEIEEYLDVWLDDHEIPNAYIDWQPGTGFVTSGDFRGDPTKNEVVRVHQIYGTDNQALDGWLDSAFADITSAHRGQGIAHWYISLSFFEGQTQVWSDGAPSSFRVLVQGKKVYDPRSDDTQSFGTGPHRLTSSGTWEYSNNPALCWADYMIDNQLGFSEATTRIDYGYVASAAEICDAVVYTPVGTDKRFTCNGILSTGDTHQTNLKRILSSMNGSMVLMNGTWRVRAWGYETPTLQFNEDHLRDDLRIKLNPDQKQRYNTVRGVFQDKDRLWKSSEFPEFTSSEYVSRDNDEVLYRDISLHMTKDVYMAQRLAAGVLEQGDNEVTVVAPFNFHAVPVEIGGTIMLSNDKLGWTDKVFRVERYAFKDMGGIDAVLREDFPTRYTDVGTAEYAVSTISGITFASPGVPAPTSLWVNGRVDGIEVNFTPPAARLYELIRVYVSPTSAWTDAEQYADVKGTQWLHRVDNPIDKYYFISAINYAGEESDRLPNSDYTDVTVGADVYGTRTDPTFDVSSNINDFWIPANSAFIGNFGEGSDRALRMFKLEDDENFGVTAIAKTVFPIISDHAIFSSRLKVDSSYGFNSGVYNPVLGMGLRMLRFVTETGTKFVTNPNTYEYLTDIRWVANINSLPLGLSTWQTLAGSVDMANVVSEYGATAVQPFITCTASELLAGVDSYGFQVNVSRFNFSFVKKSGGELDPYSITDIDDLIDTGHLDLDYRDGNSHYVKVGATISSITVQNWPDSGLLGELAITFQRSGNSTAVVNTDAWPAAVKWNSGEQLVLTTNSGGFGRVLLSTRDGGSNILIDKADEYS